MSLLVALVLAACGGESSTPALAVTAADFSFSLPDTIEGGLIRLELTNSGQDPHHMQVVKLNQGVSQQQFQETLQETLQAFPEEGEAALGRVFQIVTFTGGPSGIGPGGLSEAVVDLQAGDYVLLCFIAGADDIPHLAKGMVQPLTVTAPPSDRPAEAVMPGQSGWTTLNSQAGEYIAVCFVPSPANGFAPHVALGMVTSITVQ